MATKSYRSGALKSLHMAVEDLHAVEAIDKTTKRRFDISCLTPVEAIDPEGIRRIREKTGMSQSVFALALNVTTSLVSQWERGSRSPGGASLKLLTLVERKGVEAIM